MSKRVDTLIKKHTQICTDSRRIHEYVIVCRNKDGQYGHTVVEAEHLTAEPVVRCDGEMMMMPPAAC